MSNYQSEGAGGEAHFMHQPASSVEAGTDRTSDRCHDITGLSVGNRERCPATSGSSSTTGQNFVYGMPVCCTELYLADLFLRRLNKSPYSASSIRKTGLSIDTPVMVTIFDG